MAEEEVSTAPSSSQVCLLEMGLVPFTVFSLLLTAVSSLGGSTQSSCSTKFLLGDLQDVNSSALHLTLHQVHSPCSPVTSLPPPSSEILKHDELRVQSFISRLTKSKTTDAHYPDGDLRQESVNVPLNPGQSVGVGNYISRIGLGTPAKDYIMVIDTGSSLTWLQCSPCRVSCHDQVGPVFNPSASNTYQAMSCSSPECGSIEAATMNPSACTRSEVCVYQSSYGDGSYSIGYLSKDVLTLGSAQALAGFVYGCGQDNEGLFGKSAGLVGLAKNKLSMLSQLAPKYGNSFAYCLPTMASSGYLSIGSYNPSQFKFTPMVTNSMDSTLYFLKLVTVTVGSKALSVSSAAYAGTPTIIDSGTVISRLPSAVYSALSKAIVGAMSKYPQAPAYSILDTCFKGSFTTMSVPAVSLIFQGGAELKLAPRNVFYDVTSSTTCLAFADASSVAIIGNRQQQTFKVVYDISGSKIGFAAGGCS